MRKQLSLELEQPLRYSSAAFLPHSGVSEVVRSVNTLLALQSMPLLYIQGAPQSGKTHIGVYLAGRQVEAAQGRESAEGEEVGGARMVAAQDFATWFSEELPAEPIRFGELVVLDDADTLLQRSSAVAGREADVAGSFVDLCERVARAKGVLLLLGSVPLEGWDALPQITSRLKAGLSFVIGDPREDELDDLLDAIAKQRGLKLSDTKRQYIMRRVPRSLQALVECVERVQRFGVDDLPSTSYQKLADAVGGRERG